MPLLGVASGPPLNSAGGGGVSGEFTIVVGFDMPVGADSIKHPDARTFVSDAENQQFQYLDFGFQNLSFSTRRGEMWIRLRNNNNPPNNNNNSPALVAE